MKESYYDVVELELFKNRVESIGSNYIPDTNYLVVDFVTRITDNFISVFKLSQKDELTAEVLLELGIVLHQEDANNVLEELKDRQAFVDRFNNILELNCDAGAMSNKDVRDGFAKEVADIFEKVNNSELSESYDVLYVFGTIIASIDILERRLLRAHTLCELSTSHTQLLYNALHDLREKSYGRMWLRAMYLTSKKVETLEKEKDFVYIITEARGEQIKIGCSNNPEKRLKQLQYNYPSELVLYKTIYGSYKFEGMLHSKFKDHRKQGEWFDAIILPDVIKIMNDHDSI